MRRKQPIKQASFSSRKKTVQKNLTVHKKRKRKKRTTTQGKTTKKKQLQQRERALPKRKSSVTSKKNNRKKRRKNLWLEIGISMGIFLMLILIVGRLTVTFPKVVGYSMTPTINDQDRLVVYKWGNIRRFTIVSVTDPENSKEQLIRRVIGLPGENIRYQDGILYVNNSEVPERFLAHSTIEDSETPFTEDFTINEIVKKENRIPEGCYLVLGDNRPYATDSRFFGFVSKDDLLGVVKARIFPIHSMRQF